MLIVDGDTIAELWASPTFGALLDEYAAESAIDGLPPPRARMEMYRQLEDSGMLSVISAREDGMLVGFLTVLVHTMPHYGIAIAVSESFFVGRQHRQSMAGLKLLAAAERMSAEKRSPGLLVSAPYGGKLCELLPRCGYRETNRVFFKQVS